MNDIIIGDAPAARFPSLVHALQAKGEEIGRKEKTGGTRKALGRE